MSSVLSVVISVGNGPGLMPPLPGAHSSADEFATWSAQQGHQVIRFSDKAGKRFVAGDIEGKLTPYVDNQSLTELFIYFAGHGECLGLGRDYWLLSKQNPRVGDVIDVGKTVELARVAGISRVVIISDACRTIGDRQSLAPIVGATPILPPRTFDAIPVEVDRLWAAGPGSAALEVQFRERAAKSYGVFTRVLLRALCGQAPQVQERSEAGTKLVVRPGKLKLYLQDTVPREAAALPNGYAQRPDFQCESSLPLAVIGDVPLHTVGITTVLENGTPAANTRISLQVTNQPGQWANVGELPGPFAQFSAPSGLIYKSQASGAFPFSPERPMPLFELSSPIQGRFVAASPAPSSAEAVPSAVAARIAVTRIMDSAGRLYDESPSAGVFRVVTYDSLTQEMASDLQEFDSVHRKPKPVAIRGRPVAPLEQIAHKAAQQARPGFETRTGLTLMGFRSGGPPIVAAPPGLSDPPFLENEHWQIRVHSSGGLVLRLDAGTFAALPVFDQLIGAVRFQAAGQSRPAVEDLTYAPSQNGRYWGDLEAMQGSPDLISRSPRDEIDALQLIATKAARNGFFEVAIDESVGLASRMRRLKHINPIFGVLAAYAYDLAGRRDQIVDMIKWFLREGQTVPFDLVMLASLDLAGVQELARREVPWAAPDYEREPHRAIAPAWPMLTQGFARLGPYFLDRFPVLAEARESMLPGLWTTVVGEAGEKLFEAAMRGDLQWR
jgi:hypothetical protein